MKKSLLKTAKIISVSSLLFFTTSGYSQTDSGNSGSSLLEQIQALIDAAGLDVTITGGSGGSVIINDNTVDNPSIPLDGELGLLLLGATAFGVNKLRKKKNA